MRTPIRVAIWIALALCAASGIYLLNAYSGCHIDGPSGNPPCQERRVSVAAGWLLVGWSVTGTALLSVGALRRRADRGSQSPR